MDGDGPRRVPASAALPDVIEGDDWIAVTLDDGTLIVGQVGGLDEDGVRVDGQAINYATFTVPWEEIKEATVTSWRHDAAISEAIDRGRRELWGAIEGRAKAAYRRD